jgi:hypothetical protein
MNAADIGPVANACFQFFDDGGPVGEFALANKQDRYKSFAARASAEALRLFLISMERSGEIEA